MELGRNISWKSLSGDYQYQNFIDYREANEEIIANTVFGMKFNYHLKNWVFSTGLNYTTIGEKINYNINETVVDRIPTLPTTKLLVMENSFRAQ